MAEDMPYIPPGAEDEQSDVLGKLDDLLNRHKSRPRGAESEPVPVLTEALPEQSADAIPTLTDIVSAGAAPIEPIDHGTLERALVQRLAMRVEIERARLAAEAGGDPQRLAMLDDLAARLHAALEGIVRAALARDRRNAGDR